MVLDAGQRDVRTIVYFVQHLKYLPSGCVMCDDHVNLAVANIRVRSQLHSLARELGVAGDDEYEVAFDRFIVKHKFRVMSLGAQDV